MLLRFGVRVAGIEALARPLYALKKARGAATEADTAAALKAREAAWTLGTRCEHPARDAEFSTQRPMAPATHAG